MYGTTLAAALLVGAASAARQRAASWPQTTVYRVTPINYTGLVNMDSSDAAGDVMFGLNQLALPFLCEYEPDFIWCSNRQYLSGGTAHMVYSKFELETRDGLQGSYQMCNPDPNTGVFSCVHGYTPGANLPPQCGAFYGGNANECYNGTLYRTVPVSDAGGCCEVCEADPRCEGWSMPDGVNGTSCQMMTGPLISWEAWGGEDTKCLCAERTGRREPCWYEIAQYNVTFAPYCSRKECRCEAIQQLAVGYEPHPMCWQGMQAAAAPSRSNEIQSYLAQKQRRALSSAALAPTYHPPHNAYWNCSMDLFDKCSTLISKNVTACEVCARGISTCSAADAAALCAASADTCTAALTSVCSSTYKPLHEAQCLECAWDHADVLQGAGCNASNVGYRCENETQEHSPYDWFDGMMYLGCLMNGTWYSTTDAAYCNGTKTADCWWDVAPTVVTVNQTCVDGNVLDAVFHHNNTCFETCEQPHNISTACPVKCLFNTIMGDKEHGVAPMAKQTLVHAFERSFTETDPDKGGCPRVHPSNGSAVPA